MKTLNSLIGLAGSLGGFAIFTNEVLYKNRLLSSEASEILNYST